MRGIAGLLVVALASSLSACEAPTSGQHKTAEVAPGTKFRPAKIEDLDGWRNVRVIRTKQVRRTECDIVFSERFGLSPDEFDLLIYIVASSAELQRSSDCWASQAICYASPERHIHSERQRVDELARRTQSSVLHQVQLLSAHVRGMDRRLEALNPLAVLARGYAVVTRNEDGSVVFRVEQAAEEMSVRVSDGEFEVKKSHPR